MEARPRWTWHTLPNVWRPMARASTVLGHSTFVHPANVSVVKVEHITRARRPFPLLVLPPCSPTTTRQCKRDTNNQSWIRPPFLDVAFPPSSCFRPPCSHRDRRSLVFVSVQLSRGGHQGAPKTFKREKTRGKRSYTESSPQIYAPRSLLHCFPPHTTRRHDSTITPLCRHI